MCKNKIECFITKHTFWCLGWMGDVPGMSHIIFFSDVDPHLPKYDDFWASFPVSRWILHSKWLDGEHFFLAVRAAPPHTGEPHRLRECGGQPRAEHRHPGAPRHQAPRVAPPARPHRLHRPAGPRGRGNPTGRGSENRGFQKKYNIET